MSTIGQLKYLFKKYFIEIRILFKLIGSILNTALDVFVFENRILLYCFSKFKLIIYFTVNYC